MNFNDIDYTYIFRERVERIKRMNDSPILIEGAKQFYKDKHDIPKQTTSI